MQGANIGECLYVGSLLSRPGPGRSQRRPQTGPSRGIPAPAEKFNFDAGDCLANCGVPIMA